VDSVSKGSSAFNKFGSSVYSNLPKHPLNVPYNASKLSLNRQTESKKRRPWSAKNPPMLNKIGREGQMTPQLLGEDIINIQNVDGPNQDLPGD
jgi:hypothetical protein